MTTLLARMPGAVRACLFAGAALATFGVSSATMAAQAAVPARSTPAAAPSTGNAPVAITPQYEDRTVMSLLAAIQAKDYQRFVGAGNENFGKLDKAAFDAVATQLSPRLQAGYSADRLTQFQQQGYEFSLWKISFKDNGDDIIATLNVARDGKVGGFVLR